VIGRSVLTTLLPPRRPRYSARNVKCSTSRYHNRVDGPPAAATAIVAIDITIHTPPADRPHRLRRSPNSRPRSHPPAATASPPYSPATPSLCPA
jgi:hypothetical protein